MRSPDQLGRQLLRRLRHDLPRPREGAWAACSIPSSSKVWSLDSKLNQDDGMHPNRQGRRRDRQAHHAARSEELIAHGRSRSGAGTRRAARPSLKSRVPCLASSPASRFPPSSARISPAAHAAAGRRQVDRARQPHLTLRFSATSRRRRRASSSTASPAISMDAFEIRLAGIGVFGGNEPRSIWAGVEASSELDALARGQRARGARRGPAARGATRSSRT